MWFNKPKPAKAPENAEPDDYDISDMGLANSGRKASAVKYDEIDIDVSVNVDDSSDVREVKEAFESLVLSSFDGEAFRKIIIDKSDVLYEKLRDIICTYYGMTDAIAILTDALKESKTDAAAELTSSRMQENMEAILETNMLLLLVRETSNADDMAEMRKWVLEGHIQKRGAANETSKFIRERYAQHEQEQAQKRLQQNPNTIALLNRNKP